jgi:hypothetical protein
MRPKTTAPRGTAGREQTIDDLPRIVPAGKSPGNPLRPLPAGGWRFTPPPPPARYYWLSAIQVAGTCIVIAETILRDPPAAHVDRVDISIATWRREYAARAAGGDEDLADVIAGDLALARVAIMLETIDDRLRRPLRRRRRAARGAGR